MKLKILKFKSVKSTNDIAHKLIKKKKIRPTIILSEKQTNGRGTMGKKWISKKGNLFVSIFFSLKSIDYSITKLSTINLNIIKKLLSMYTKEKIFIKKPNDIMIDKKLEKECSLMFLCLIVK